MNTRSTRERKAKKTKGTLADIEDLYANPEDQERANEQFKETVIPQMERNQLVQLLVRGPRPIYSD
jgi:hypothetical protein